MNTRDWPIRSKLTALVVVPVTALLALWIFATTLTFGPALDLLAARTLLYDLGRPGETVVTELQRERRLSVVQLAGDGTAPGLAEQRQRTDRAIAELRRRVGGEDLRDAADHILDARLDQLATALEALPAGRKFIDQRAVDRAGAIGLYSGMINSAFQAFSAMANLPDRDLNRQALAVTALGRSRELLGQTDALLAGAFIAGRFADGERLQLVQTIGNQRFLAETAVADLPDAERAAFQRMTEGEAFGRLRTMQDTLVGTGSASSRPTVDPTAWQESYQAVQQALRDFELAQADGLADRSVPSAVRILGRLGAAGVLGLAAVVVSVLVSLRVGRNLAHRLTGVRTAALETAERRLPDVVARLRRGEQVDVAREAPPLEYGRDEIGQVARAFTEVQRTAVQSAVDEVTLRRGLNEVFLNIARRSQGLVHRQLALLDRMERHTEDPDELAELFRVDHLATRLRRHAEDLVILAGAAPGRGWRNPVATVDLARGAISEVESYDRVDITAVAPAGVLGRAVGDVIHLLAELIENATAFSPPQTRVAVSGEHVANGYAIEITDRGLGMSAAALEDTNRRLARSPDFEPTETARLGHFVVARLAARHGVRVRLRPSDGGGLTAVVLIPADLVTDEPSLPPTGGPPVARPAAGTPEERRLARASRLSTLPRPARAAAPATVTPAAARPAPPGGTAGPAPNGAAHGGPTTGGAAPGVPARNGVASGVPTPVGEVDGLPRRVRRRPPTPGPRQSAPGTPGPRQSAPGTPGPRQSAPGTPGGQPSAGEAPGRWSALDGPTLRQPLTESPAPRSPEEARRAMSALQAGTARGRAAATGAAPDRASGGSAAAPGPASEQTGDGTTAAPTGPAAAGTTDRQGRPPEDPSPTSAERPVEPEPKTATERDA
ncbi:nitrate- and nitrite sensing domain-containing protein [Micromonospora sp. C31]|uniref:sensor histidine kinase n=1 Tax=Micromonospora sp. C31 TaxID=2824876 RepID=UPI001B396018|nr:nitrate- and nitrite sensing domain-containing protein [Micromonospora sp. C31]MBQ1071699.1 nitrate- and nitrite sensing domain-containing protein [Micromonospora sp. C31]